MHEGVTITGSASVDVEPDIVVADLGVDVREADVSTALATAERGLARMRDTLVERGVARTDIRTAQTSIWREDRTDERGELVATVVHARLGLHVTLREIAVAGDLVHAALAAAGDSAQLDSMGFAVSDAAAALAQAREAAFDDAATVAATYARRAGRTLGRVRAIVEDPGGPRPVARMLKASADVGSSMPVEPGQQTVTASVTLTWELAD